MSLDDIIKINKKKPKQPSRSLNAPNSNLNNNSKSKTGPIRARSAGKSLTRQKANPYPVRIYTACKETQGNTSRSFFIFSFFWSTNGQNHYCCSPRRKKKAAKQFVEIFTYFPGVFTYARLIKPNCGCFDTLPPSTHSETKNF